MIKLQLKKVIVTSFAVAVLFLSLSVCTFAAGIDKLSVVDNTIYASVSEGNITLFAAEYDEALLSDVFFATSDENGYIELSVGDVTKEEYKLFLWDKKSLAPLYCTYNLLNGQAYAQGSDEAVPPYEFETYAFNQEDDVMVVSSVSEEFISGFKAGTEVTYSLTEDFTVVGLSDTLEDVVPGCVVLLSTNGEDSCNSIELLASLGMPVSTATFEQGYGVHTPSDGSTKYQNIVTKMFAKDMNRLSFYTIFNENGSAVTPKDENGKTIYYSFEDGSNAICYRVSIVIEDSVPVISSTGRKISSHPSIFESTADYTNYMYIRYNTETNMISQCVYYCVPRNYNFNSDGEYSNLYNLGNRIIIQ